MKRKKLVFSGRYISNWPEKVLQLKSLKILSRKPVDIIEALNVNLKKKYFLYTRIIKNWKEIFEFYEDLGNKKLTWKKDVSSFNSCINKISISIFNY